MELNREDFLFWPAKRSGNDGTACTKRMKHNISISRELTVTITMLGINKLWALYEELNEFNLKN